MDSTAGLIHVIDVGEASSIGLESSSGGYMVLRMAGLRPIDLIALKAGEKPTFIECKTERNPSQSS